QTCSFSEAGLTPPHDLFMLTLNTNYTLTWDWDQSAAGSDSATFTVQYLKKRNPKWTTVCAETSGRSCDLTRSGLNYLGLYTVRVQTNLNGSHSVWKSIQFCPDKDAAIGPPSKVRLGVSGSTLDIFITDPQNSSNNSMKEQLHKLYYEIVYWEQPEDGKGSMTMTMTTDVTILTLSEVEPWTRYCVQIRSRDDFYNKSSTFTPPLCIQTEGVVPWWKIFLFFLLSLVSCFLVVLLFLYGSHHCFHVCKATFLPNEKLPSYFKELLIPNIINILVDSVFLCNWLFVDICVLTEYFSVCSGRHSRQNSSSSGDSGVYSAGGNSAGLQPKVALTFTDVNPTFNSEKLNMLSMNSEIKVSPIVPDEGVEDIEV
uniref:Fibronectin type-III domain-containing protein n=1 Tax=Poecilia mexicana TaxID=48701 RepID=A0A3B3XGQ1_9TELE